VIIRRTMLGAAALLLAAGAQAQTKWDMPTPYSDGEFHTRNVKAFAEDVKKPGEYRGIPVGPVWQ
jgi:TRAP-type C4-dicarboxylate transport system substrate-binding protein